MKDTGANQTGKITGGNNNSSVYGGGRMTGVESHTAGQKTYTFSFGTGSTVKVFLLDAGFRPPVRLRDEIGEKQ